MKLDSKALLITAIVAIIILGFSSPVQAKNVSGTGTLYMYSDSSCSTLLSQSGGIQGYVIPTAGPVYIKIMGITEFEAGEISILLQYSGYPNVFLSATVDSEGNTNCVEWDMAGPWLTPPTDCLTGVVSYGPAGDTDVSDFYTTLSNGGSDGGHFYWGTECFPSQPSPPTVYKDAAGSYKTTYKWTINKECSFDGVTWSKDCEEDVTSSSVTIYYRVTVTHDEGTISDVMVTGTIDAFNPNTPSLTATITDQLSDTTICTVTGGSGATLVTGDNYFSYECDLTGLPAGDLYNTVTLTWDEQTLSTGTLAAGSTFYTTPDPITFTNTVIDGTVSVSDTELGALGTASVSAACTHSIGVTCTDFTGPPDGTTFVYSKTYTLPVDACLSIENTATVYGPDAEGKYTVSLGSSTATVKVCPQVKGFLTMGFWKNKNGQNIIKGQTGTPCPSTAYLRQFAPFQDLLSSSSCTEVASYVNGVITAASAGGATMNAMLKAQMLATALDVYFSGSTSTSCSISAATIYCGGNAINAPVFLGTVTIDLTNICKVSNGACTGVVENTAAAFGNTPACQTVLSLLKYASSQSNSGGSDWYGQVKATQELAKDTFDCINNSLAFTC
jgi:hypothetical protein